MKAGHSIIPDIRQQGGNTRLFISDQLQETGIYDLKRQDSLVSAIAFNDNRKESDMSHLTSSDLKLKFPQAANILQPGPGSLKGEVAQLNFGLQLWKLCIILALVFLTAEILLVRFYNSDIQQVAKQV